MTRPTTTKRVLLPPELELLGKAFESATLLTLRPLGRRVPSATSCEEAFGAPSASSLFSLLVDAPERICDTYLAFQRITLREWSGVSTGCEAVLFVLVEKLRWSSGCTQLRLRAAEWMDKRMDNSATSARELRKRRWHWMRLTAMHRRLVASLQGLDTVPIPAGQIGSLSGQSGLL
jgi:hypothetical protein